jgi:hypothetical protein
MALVWITAARGVMAIVLGLGLALHNDRAPAALVKFMGVYWILNGMVTFQWGPAAEGPRRRLPLAAGAIGIVTGAVVLLANVGTTFLLAILGVVDRADGDRPSARWLRAGRQVGPALASRSAAGNSRGWARGDADPDVGPERFPLDVARKRVGGPRWSSARL